MAENNGWHEWSKHVLYEIERGAKSRKELWEKHTEIKTEIAVLKVKSGIWGAIAGLAGAVGAIAVKALFF